MSLLRFVFIVTILLCGIALKAQIVISGTVYDSTKLYSITGVKVVSTGGNTTMTDSNGVYHIIVTPKDSISFYYANRPTTKFPVQVISNYNQFDISLRVRAKERYKMLREVRVFSMTHKEDSLQNRQLFAKIFNFSKPGLRSDMGTSGVAGFDLDQLINVFKFRRNKQILKFQKFMEYQEAERYVDFRFNSQLINKMTGLAGDSLISYKHIFRPPYEFITTSSMTEFYSYIIKSVSAFRGGEVRKPNFSSNQ
ncbi:MAG: hypothetical protein NVS3B19_00730 [Ginsengibacter sp.]